jgi:hypothetical protein
MSASIRRAMPASIRCAMSPSILRESRPRPASSVRAMPASGLCRASRHVRLDPQGKPPTAHCRASRHVRLDPIAPCAHGPLSSVHAMSLSIGRGPRPAPFSGEFCSTTAGLARLDHVMPSCGYRPSASIGRLMPSHAVSGSPYGRQRRAPRSAGSRHHARQRLAQWLSAFAASIGRLMPSRPSAARPMAVSVERFDRPARAITPVSGSPTVKRRPSASSASIARLAPSRPTIDADAPTILSR